jgi:hypothetical protein
MVLSSAEHLVQMTIRIQALGSGSLQNFGVISATSTADYFNYNLILGFRNLYSTSASITVRLHNA